MKRFFRIRQDKALREVICLRNFNICGSGHIFHKSDAPRINQMTVLYLAADSGEIIPDFVQSPVYMVSGMMKSMFDMYEDNLIFKKVSMIHKEQQKQIMYYQILMDEIEAISDDVERYPNGNEKVLILDQKKIGQHKIFMLSDSQMKDPIISLEVLESLKRRRLMGVIIEEVEVR